MAKASAKSPNTKKKIVAKKTAAPAKKGEKASKTSKASDESGVKLVSVEACKQWGAFKTRAGKIEQSLKGIAIVKINEEKPGKGNFVVRIEGRDEPVLKLEGLKRPFPALKALDMDEVVENIKALL